MLGYAWGASRVLLSRFSRGAVCRGQRIAPLHTLTKRGMKYLDANTAAAVDEMLMGPEVDYTLEQLMELAGLAVAQVVRDFCPDKKTVTIVAGPGNNGGDGLVAARHLDLFGYEVTVLEPKPGRKEHFSKLRRQLEWTGVTFVSRIPSSEVIVDSIFGFSFKGDVREPFRELIREINLRSDAQIVCVDVPSGWDIDGKELPPDAIRVESPGCVVSLTAPKEAVRRFKGVHYLGGRFVPKLVQEKLGLDSYQWSGSAGILRVD